MDTIPKPPPKPDDEPKTESQTVETLILYFFGTGNESESAVKVSHYHRKGKLQSSLETSNPGLHEDLGITIISCKYYICLNIKPNVNFLYLLQKKWIEPEMIWLCSHYSQLIISKSLVYAEPKHILRKTMN